MELQQLKDKDEKQAREEKERQKQEEKRKQDSIVNAKKPENYCVGTWKQTVNEILGEKGNKPPNILTLFKDKTYKEKLIMADGYSAMFETGRWDVKNGDVALYLEQSDYAAYVESMHYTLKGNKLISKYWVLQNGKVSPQKDFKEVFTKIEK